MSAPENVAHARCSCLVMRELENIVKLLGTANLMVPIPIDQWPADIGMDYADLEAQAAKLTFEEVDIFVDGEEYAASEITDKHGIQQLS